MSKDKSKYLSDDFEKEFSDIDLALDVSPEMPYDDDGSDEFQKEFKAVFEEESETNKKKFAIVSPDGVTSGVYDWIRCVIFSVAIVVFVLTFAFRLVEVDGKSMNDTLANQDKVIVTNLFYTPHNNDVIVISHATNYNKPIIKRVIAIGGQKVKLDYENDKIFVDGVELYEPYTKIKNSAFADNKGDNYIPLNDEGSFIVPDNKLFVMGDNRAQSLDSRSETIGLIDINDVIGKAQFVAFPFEHFGYVYDK